MKELIVELRKQHGLTQEAMANALFVSRQTIYKWETGKAQPDLQKFAQICELFQVSADTLLGITVTDNRQEIKESEVAEKSGDDGNDDMQPDESQPDDEATLQQQQTAKPKKERYRRCRLLLSLLLLVLIVLSRAGIFTFNRQDAEIREARTLGFVPDTVDAKDETITERTFFQMLLIASQHQHPQEIPQLISAVQHLSNQPLTREKAAYWIYCTHVWTMIDEDADLSIGQHKGADPISQRNVYEDLNEMSRTQIPEGDPWDAQLCEELSKANALFESYDGTTVMDTQITKILNSAYYTAITFCAAQHCFGSEKTIMEVANGCFRTKEFLTAQEAIHAVLRLYQSW